MLNRIINLIKQDFDKHCDLHDDCNDCPYSSDYDAPCHCKDIKEFDWNNYLLKKVSVTNNWISVKDRLPKQDELVLCYNARRIRVKSNRPFIGKYLGSSYSEDMYPFLSVDRGCSAGATHWQPLPESPAK